MTSPENSALPSSTLALEAIRTLNHNDDPQEKAKASLWLSDLQKSLHAWKISDELLHRKEDMESCYFAAQTMRMKIETSFPELPAEAHLSLRDSILEHVGSITEDANPIIVRQICLALADLMLQMSEWKDSVRDILQRFGSTKPFVLLEVLTLLPEEIYSRHFRLGEIRRKEIMAEFMNIGPVVMEFWNACLHLKTDQSKQERLLIEIFKCQNSWIQIGVLYLANIDTKPVTIRAFQSLSNINESPDIHEIATDMVCSLMEALELRDDLEDLDRRCFNLVQSLVSSYITSVAHEDFGKCVNYCRIFTVFGESFLTKIVTNSTPQTPHFAIQIFDSVLTCCGHPDYDIPDITFNLWYRLSEEVYQINNDVVTLLYKPYVERLISCLCRHCQIDSDHEGLLDEKQEFSEFRAKALELVKDVVFIVGPEITFQKMYEYLLGVSNWEVMEAALYVMSAVARYISVHDDKAVPPVLESILILPASAHIAVKHTALKLVGELGDWIDVHPEYLQRIFYWFRAGLNDSNLASEAANGLQNICSTCRRHMGPHFLELIQVLEAMESFNLKPVAANGLLKGMANIMSNMPQESIEENMRSLCWLQIGPLNKIMMEEQTVNGKISKHSQGDPVIYLDRLASILRHTSLSVAAGTVHPCQAVVAVIWPYLSKACDKYQDDNRIIERCCRTIRFAIRCVGIQSGPLLEPLAKQMVTIYQSHPHSCFLYLGSILVDEFSHVEECIPGLLSMLEAFLPKTFQLLQAENGLRNNPDTLDDFFRLNVRFIQRAPVPYLQSTFIPSVIECGLISVSIDHREANASVMKFFFDLLHCGRSKENAEDFQIRFNLVSNLKNSFAPKLVYNLIFASVFQLPSYTFHDIGDVIFELMLYDRTEVCQWLERSLTELPNKSQNGMEAVSRKQLVQFHKEATMAENSKAVSDAIRDFSRLWK